MLSILYAKVLSIYLIVLSLALFVNANTFRACIAEVQNNRFLIIMAGVYSLLVGTIILVTHPIWHGWPVIVTLVGVISFLAGILRLFATDFIVHRGAHVVSSRQNVYYSVATVVLLLGIILAYFGFVHVGVA